MAGVSLPGLGSGLDTARIVRQLMQIEARPQHLLQQKVAGTQQSIKALQGINSKVAALSAAAGKLTPGEDTAGAGWGAVSATSSSDAVSTASTPPAGTGSLRFSVTSLADAFFVATAAVANQEPVVAGNPPTLQFTMADGSTATVSPIGHDVASVVAAINKANIGVSAASIPQSDGSSRLQLSSKQTGADTSFTVTGLTVGTEIEHPGSDAVIDFGSGLTASSASGTFHDLVPGTDITVSGLAENVTVSVVRDDAAVTENVRAMIDAANAALNDISAQTKSTVGSNGSNTKTSPLTGDSTVRELASAITGAISSSGVSPAEAGVSVDRDGRFTFDEVKFTELLAADPAKAQELIGGLAGRLTEVAEAASDTSDGTLTAAVKNRQEQVKDMNTQVDAWDDRLELRRKALQSQFTALDVAMAKLNTQASWLAGQIASLPQMSTTS
ncbi:MAG: hypothetical protein CSA58_08745 [Micrococcales bacterium]|nr:MAG: hypothetical protein CSA58_08745 [Micrococcales bacterium]